MTVVRKVATIATSSLDFDETSPVRAALAMMTDRCEEHHHLRHQDHHPHHFDHQQRQQQQRSVRFKSVVRRVLVALSFRLGRHRAESPPGHSVAAFPDGADDEGCGGGPTVTSTSTVTSTAGRLAAVEEDEEEQHSHCNTPVRNCHAQGISTATEKRIFQLSSFQFVYYY